MTAGIYKITNTVNGKFYIGSTVNLERRKSQHYSLLRKNNHFNRHLQSSWNKHGEEAFIFEVIIVVPDVDDLIGIEQAYLDDMHPSYNIQPRAESSLGRKLTESTRAKISAANKGKTPHNKGKTGSTPWNKGKPGKPLSDEHKTLISAANKGKILSDETKAKISAAKKGKSLSDEHKAKLSLSHKGKPVAPEVVEKRRGRVPWNKGRPLSQEEKDHLSAINKGKHHSPETREKMRGHVPWMKGKHHTPEARTKISEANKRRAHKNQVEPIEIDISARQGDLE